MPATRSISRRALSISMLAGMLLLGLSVEAQAQSGNKTVRWTNQGTGLRFRAKLTPFKQRVDRQVHRALSSSASPELQALAQKFSAAHRAPVVRADERMTAVQVKVYLKKLRPALRSLERSQRVGQSSSRQQARLIKVTSLLGQLPSLFQDRRQYGVYAMTAREKKALSGYLKRYDAVTAGMDQGLVTGTLSALYKRDGNVSWFVSPEGKPDAWSMKTFLQPNASAKLPAGVESGLH